MAFPSTKAASLLAAVHRRCCICHRFCGTKIELHHMVPKGQKGTDQIDNAIPVCFECHADMETYNRQHPRGRSFTPAELRQHKAHWLKICETNSTLGATDSRDGDVGPIQALIDELIFNAVAAEGYGPSKTGCPLRETQFDRAIHEGVISILDDTLRDKIVAAYVSIGKVNHALGRLRVQTDGRRQSEAVGDVSVALASCAPECRAASGALMGYLGHADDAA
jgi:hypothetical protein